MRHVFVETNWVVDLVAPAHHRNPAAVRLYERARSGELVLHVPAPCLVEARPPIVQRFQPREAKPVRKFLRWATREGIVTDDDAAATRRVLDALETSIERDLDAAALAGRLAALRTDAAVEVFPLDEAMLTRAVLLTELDLGLRPHDHAILAAILVRTEQLASSGEQDFCFATLDGDLQPWVRGDPLRALCDRAQLWVYRDFELRVPVRPDGWPSRTATAD